MVWKVTPLFAAWLASPANNILFRSGLLTPSSTILELGCGVSALVGLAAGPLVGHYVLTDQQYVARFVEQNISQNRRPAPTRSTRRSKGGARTHDMTATADRGGHITFRALDWELDTPTPAAIGLPDVVVACDCIYNEALIPPFVQTCVDACGLRPEEDGGGSEERRPCVCVVAQQLRDPEIFEGWLKEFMRNGFRVWRLPDAELPEGLRSSSGFTVHIGILREAIERV